MSKGTSRKNASNTESRYYFLDVTRVAPTQDIVDMLI